MIVHLDSSVYKLRIRTTIINTKTYDTIMHYHTVSDYHLHIFNVEKLEKYFINN